MTKNIWEKLTIDTAMNAVESVVNDSLTNVCLPRNSYINRVYEMELRSKDRLIIKFYRPNRWSKDMILGEHHFLEKCAEFDLPVIPPLRYNDQTLFPFHDSYFAIFPKKGGRVIDELNEDLWKETGRLLARLHNVSETITNSKRMIWQPAIVTKEHLETLIKTNVCPDDYKEPVINAVNQFIKKANPLFLKEPMMLLHGDCHFGNLIYRPDESLYLVDFDDSVIGPVVQDLWMLLPDEPEHCKKELAWFQEGYTTFRPFPSTSLSLIPSLRIMRQIHFAAWCAIQADEPHFKHHFPDWGSLRYWNEWVKDIYNLT